MGIFTRMAMGAAVRTGGVGVSGYAAWKTKTPKMEELAEIVQKADRRGYLDRLPEGRKTELWSMVEKKDRNGLADALSQLAQEGKLGFSLGDSLPMRYTKEEREHMRAEAEDLLARANVHLEKLESVLPKTVEKTTVEKSAAYLKGKLEQLDEKYRDVKPEVLQARIREATVAGFFGEILKHNDKELRALGLSDEQIQMAQSLRAQLKAEKQELKAAKKAGRDEDTARLDTPPDVKVDLLQDGAQSTNDGRSYRVQISVGDNNFGIAFGKGDNAGLDLLRAARKPGEMSGWEVLSKLGVDWKSIDEAGVQRILDQNTMKQERNSRLGKDFLHVIRTHKRTFAKAAVNMARVEKVPPEEFISAMKDLKKALEGVEQLAMAGKDSYQKIIALQEVRAALALLVDTVVLGAKDIPGNLVGLLENPETQRVLKDVVESPDIKAQIDKLGESLENISRTLDRIGH
jgi:hypothetical protein